MTAPEPDPAEVPRSALADTVLARLTVAHGAAADPERAATMRAYMKDTFPFLGIPAPARRALSRTVLAGTARPEETDCRAVALRCWALPEREYHYFAADYLRRHVGRCSSSFLPVVRHLVTTDSWWDTVDPLAVHVVGPLVAADRSLAPVMDDWVADDDLWLVRAGLLHQLRYRERTDAERLFAHCLSRAGHPDFFVRKAIGWALREYARTDPRAVHDFLAREGGHFARLTVREALKHAGG
ncbi:DNA alkylation repair protein [Streptomyces actuosus]|uniref:DNA alkylation repair protein n=1 Tax=Streptomyces actuosus TaxID=1885 RepID=A0ABS2VWN2_STRAS|nr:DNA alkylation repair protein [Streptomyces actuosus]MBN0047559.1 DNA alkylation repair protein [Streptomyces actuosus]